MTTPEHVEYPEASQMARFMGLAKWQSISDIALVEQIEAGLPVKTAEIIAKRVDPKGDHVHVHDIIPKATLYRRKERKKPLTKDESEKVLALSRVFAETLRQYAGDTQTAVLFLTHKHSLLGGRSPFDVARGSTTGADLVLDLLASAEAGTAV